MKVIQGSECEVENRKDKRAGRGGSGHKTRILMNDAILNRDGDRPDNFYVGISSVDEGEFFTPRHRHNFDQWRYMIDGHSDFTTGVMTTGVLGYFPEGAYYGPQENVQGTLILVQFGGPSGSGYISRDHILRAHAEMRSKNTGVFQDGRYRRNPGVEGPPEQDAYEAQWEYIRNRPLQYPLPQYSDPILIDTNAYPSLPVAGAPGVSEKSLGTFSSCRFRASRYMLEPGASFAAKERGVYFVLSGKGTVAGEPVMQYTALYLDDGEEAVFAAEESTDILLMGLPSMALMQAPAAVLEATTS